MESTIQTSSLAYEDFLKETFSQKLSTFDNDPLNIIKRETAYFDNEPFFDEEEVTNNFINHSFLKTLERRDETKKFTSAMEDGTVTEAIDSAEIAFKNDWQVQVSHRSGETNEKFIADLAVVLGNGQIKSGAPCRGERLAKYNQLLKIESDFAVPFVGRKAFPRLK